MEDMRKAVAAHPRVEVGSNIVGTSEQVPQMDRVPRPFTPASTENQDMVEIPQSAIRWKSPAQPPVDGIPPTVQLSVGNVPLEYLQKLRSQAHEELSRREEITYAQKRSVKQGYLTAMRENIEITPQKSVVEAKMVCIRETVGTL